MDEVIWVVSDLHLGLNESNDKEYRESKHKEFAEFLEYVVKTKKEALKKKKAPKFNVNNSDIEFSPPTKLILLGDILELNDPQYDLFKSTAIHLFESLESLLELGDKGRYEVWYITGNHDEGMEDYALKGYLEKSYGGITSFLLNFFSYLPVIGDYLFRILESLLKRPFKLRPKPEGVDQEPYANYYDIKNPRFRIIPRIANKPDSEYPYERELDPRRIKVGNKFYFFFHGHGFDKGQTFVGWLNRMPGIFQRINQIRNSIGYDGGLTILALWGVLVILKYFFDELLPQLELPYLLGLLEGAFTAILPGTIFLMAFSYIWVKYLHRLWPPLSRFIKKIFRLIGVEESTKNMSIARIVDKKYYDFRKDHHFDAVKVFGHTHIPEIYTPSPKDNIDKTFINTGGWVLEGLVKDNNEGKTNTFVVIDEKGALLLRWEGKEKGFSLIDSYHQSPQSIIP